MPSRIEERVDALKKLRARAETLDDAMRSIRLGADIEMKFKRFFWRDMVYMHGWGRITSEPLPVGVEREFYLFLGAKADALAKEIRQAETVLSAYENGAK